MSTPKRTGKKKGSTDYDPTLREAISIILEKHDLTLDVKLSVLKENQEALNSLVGVLSFGLASHQTNEYWSRFVKD